MKLDLLSGVQTIVNPGSDSETEKADIISLMSQPQWQSLRAWWLRQGIDFLLAAGTAAKEEAYILARLGKFIVDTIEAMDTFSPSMPEPKKDEYDDGDPLFPFSPSPQDLPLPPDV